MKSTCSDTDTIRIGVNPIVWSNDDMRELGANISLETCLREAREAGYAGIELGHKFPRDAATLKPLLATFQLDLISGWYSSALMERSVEEEKCCLEDHLSLLRTMGCKIVIWADCSGAIHGDIDRSLGGRPQLSEQQWPEFADKMNKMAEHVRQYGLQVAYHHHMGTLVQSEADIDELMNRTDHSVGLLLDTGHLVMAGASPDAVLSRHIERIVHFHAKDIRLNVFERFLTSDWTFLRSVLEGVFTVPGDGHIDYAPLLNRLRDTDYRGWVVIEAEQDPEKAQPFEYVQKGYRHIAHCLTSDRVFRKALR